jgi:hypothetical protein
MARCMVRLVGLVVVPPAPPSEMSKVIEFDWLVELSPSVWSVSKKYWPS